MIHTRRISNRLKMTTSYVHTYTRAQPCGFPCCTQESIFTSTHVAIPSASYLLSTLPDRPLLVLQSTLRELKARSASQCRKVRAMKDKVFVFLNDFHPETALSSEDMLGDASPYSILEEKALEFYRKHLPSHTFEKIDSVVEHPVYEEYMDNLDFEVLRGNVHRGKLHTRQFEVHEGVVVANDKRIVVCGERDMNRALNGDIVYVEIKQVPVDEEAMHGEAAKAAGLEEQDSDFMQESQAGTGTKSPVCGRVVGIHRRRHQELVGTLVESPESGADTQVVLVSPMDRRVPLVSIRTSSAHDLEGKRIVFRVVGWERDSLHPQGQYQRTLGCVGDLECEVRSLLLLNGISQTEQYFRPSMFRMTLQEMVCGCENGSAAVHAEDLQCVLETARHARSTRPTDEFSPQELERVHTALSMHFHSLMDLGTREDHRASLVFSIDPPLCTDIDDALHIKVRDTGYEIGIHIADVSHFVKRMSVIDREALRRGTTVYLEDRRIEMLPEFLSSDLCSLKSGVERCTMSVLVDMDFECNVRRASVRRCMVRPAFSFTYEQAQRILDESRGPGAERTLYECRFCRESGGGAVHGVRESIGVAGLGGASLVEEYHTAFRPGLVRGECTCRSKDYEAAPAKLRTAVRSSLAKMNEIAKVLRARRFERGALDLSMVPSMDANHLVEEYMLLANICVAKIMLKSGMPALLRVHPEMSAESLAVLRALSIDTNNLSECIRDKDVEKIIVTRCTSQATYKCSESTSDYRHYGLAVSEYTHFTSPIRRYADIVVHRILSEMMRTGRAFIAPGCDGESLCAGGGAPFDSEQQQHSPDGTGFDYAARGFRSGWYEKSELDEICAGINAATRSAKIAAREVERLFAYYSLKEGCYDAVVIGVEKDRMQVYIKTLGIDEAIFASGPYSMMDVVTVSVRRDDQLFFMERRFNVEIVKRD